MSTLYLDPVVTSTTQARHWMTESLRGLPLEVSECAALLTSELVTNAVLHAGTPLSVTLHLLSGRIRVDVADGSPVLPSLKEYGPDAATGTGPHPVQHPGLRLGRARRAGGQDRLVRAPGRPPRRGAGELRRELPIRPDRRGPGQRARGGGPSAPDDDRPARDPGGPAAEGQRGVRRAVPRIASDEGARRLRRDALGAVARSAVGAGLGDRQPFQRLRPRHGRELAGGGGPQCHHLRLAHHPATVGAHGLRVLHRPARRGR